MTAIYFYCPLKESDENAASGVKRVGALFQKALVKAGFDIETPALPLGYEGNGNPQAQDAIAEAATAAARKLIADLRRRNLRPRAWFTYHCYYKAPDLIGPAVSEALGCPYVIAEGSYASKRLGGPWDAHHRRSEQALGQADILLALTGRDHAGLESVPNRRGKIVSFAPFIDEATFSKAVRSQRDGPFRILAAGSMRDARKLESYRRLFYSLRSIPVSSYVLRIAGDGENRNVVEAQADALRSNGAKIEFLGQLPPSKMSGFFANGDLFAWPGVGEAYGLTYLEAQASGLPVVAENFGGVSACVQNGVSGFLVNPTESGSFGAALERFISERDLATKLGLSAQSWVRQDRSLSAASTRIAEILTEAGA